MLSAPSAPSTTISREVLSQLATVVQQRLLDQRQLADEYRRVLELDRLIDHTVTAAVAGGNSSHNRYVNVLPYDYNRVQLANVQLGRSDSWQLHAATASSTSGYVNASFVRVSDPICSQQFNYIASQGPLPSTVASFWHMIMDQRVAAIVMLTNLSERGMTKCAKYYPLKEGESLNAGSIDVTAVSVGSICDGELTKRILQVRDSATGQVQTVSHYQYHGWPDHGAPSSAVNIRMVCAKLQVGRQDDPQQQAVVHCSAGIGRTGTFIAIDILQQRIELLSRSRSVSAQQIQDTLDLPAIVHELRQQRMGMVQTFEQYVFIYRAVHEQLMEQLQQLTASA